MGISKSKIVKPWQRKEWREKRREFLRGKSCEWCSSQKTLVIHHREHFYDNMQYPEIALDYFEKYINAPSNQVEYQQIKRKAEDQITPKYVKACPKCENSSIKPRTTITPIYRCHRCLTEFDVPKQKIHQETKNEIWEKMFEFFLNEHKSEVDNLFSTIKKKSDESYLGFENVMVLCKRCHMAVEKGLILCTVCKKRYHKPDFEMCKNCFTKTEKGQRIAHEREKLSYKHPWCGKEFLIELQFWEIQGNPQGCCLYECRLIYSSCEIANQKWGIN